MAARVSSVALRSISRTQVRTITGSTDPRQTMKVVQATVKSSFSLVKFAPWAIPVGMIGSWMVYPALGEEKQANFRFLVSLGMMGKNPFKSS
ncbi:hypothetical protein AAMO2058_000362400 [Amorphochlora amoebiformis]|mmetsp:Transcript_11999/g.19081  ORF Transcript_11999/g.19081 Transcript_11999/m.19081 type:complete len:92 (+) Transcript_11999:39-314(+)|eukprot:1287175-Amorphochlora_amoeboformis.AAC.1